LSISASFSVLLSQYSPFEQHGVIVRAITTSGPKVWYTPGNLGRFVEDLVVSTERTIEVTRLLREFRPGDDRTASRLMELIYPELKKLARARLRGERPGHDLQATALVHEAYMRLVAHDHHTWENRTHFYAAAANIMRRILIDHARFWQAKKREGERNALSLDEALMLSHEQSAELLELDEALTELEKLSPRQARVVELRYFAGLSVPEAARALGVNARTVDRDWATARAWLRARLKA
jgi:RNA polymerase sigma factor (TIGR02999 family)